MNNYKELKIWQKSVDLAVRKYEETKTFLKEETYGLISQMWRSAVSTASNIAEGSGRYSKKELVNFLGISRRSSYKLDTQLSSATNAVLMIDNTGNSLQFEIQEIRKMNYGLKHLR